MDWLPSGYTLSIKDFHYETNSYRPGNYSKLYHATFKASTLAHFRQEGVPEPRLASIPPSFALKIIDKTMLKRLAYRHPHVQKEVMQEKQTALRLNGYQHYFPRLYTTFQDSTCLYFLYEYIDQGKELWDYCMDTVVYNDNKYTGEELDIVHHSVQQQRGIPDVSSSSSSSSFVSPSVATNLLHSSLTTLITNDIEYIQKHNSTPSLPKSPIPLPVPTVQLILHQLIKGLRYLHGQGIVHRDLKPENIVIDRSFSSASSLLHCCIVDFGTVKDLIDETYNNPSDFVGTPDYMPPEALESKTTAKATSSTAPPTETTIRRTDCTTDLWALGCIAYQLLCGSPPFHSPSAYLTFERILSYDSTNDTVTTTNHHHHHHPYPSTELLFPPNVPDAAIEFITQLLQRDRSKRLGVVKEGGQVPGSGVNTNVSRSSTTSNPSTLQINYDLLLGHRFLSTSYSSLPSVSSSPFTDTEILSPWRNKIAVIAKMIITELRIPLPSIVLKILFTVTNDNEKLILSSLTDSRSASIPITVLENWLKWRRIVHCYPRVSTSSSSSISGASSSQLSTFITLTETEKYELIHYLALRRVIHQPHILTLFVSSYANARSLPLRLYNPSMRVPYLIGGGGGGYHSSHRELYGWNIANDQYNYTTIDGEKLSPSTTTSSAPNANIGTDKGTQGNWERIEEYSWSKSFYVVCVPNPCLSLSQQSSSFRSFTILIQSINRLNPPPRAIIILGQWIDTNITNSKERQTIMDESLNILTNIVSDSTTILFQTNDRTVDVNSTNDDDGKDSIVAIPHAIPSSDNTIRYRFATQWIQGCRMYYYSAPSSSSDSTMVEKELLWLQKDIAVMRSVAQHSLVWYSNTTNISLSSVSSSIVTLETLSRTILKESNGHNIRYISTPESLSIDPLLDPRIDPKTNTTDTTTTILFPPYRSPDQYVEGENAVWQPLRKKEIRTVSSIPVTENEKTITIGSAEKGEKKKDETVDCPVKIITWPSLANLCTRFAHGTDTVPVKASPSRLSASLPSPVPLSSSTASTVLVSSSLSPAPEEGNESPLFYIPTIKINSLRLEPGYVKVDTRTDTTIEVTLLPNEE